MTPETATAKALIAAAAWGGTDGTPRLINNRENAVFEVRFSNGMCAALRLHRMGYQSTASIKSELLWTEKLHEAGFACPNPIRTSEDALTYELYDGQIASAVSWIEATPIGESDVLFDGSAPDHCALYRNVGRLIGQLHQATDAIDTAPLQRPLWDSEALLGDDPHWGRFWENPSLAPDEATLLQTARDKARAHLLALDMSIVLIHADLLQENILHNNDGLWLIDFDDGGFGYRGYDLGTALIQHAELPYMDDLSKALMSGYQSVCGPQPEIETAIPLFVMLRSMASCGWIISRTEPGDPRQRVYAERALHCTRSYL
ncbi:phosphotransferase enzyme family protein [Litoreibacter janthinus]|uniref:Ser/Thr protein kinase RdoA involved in Cpx stress response, MazF antagonist n=1 Tax=Litoreibacter janthinus TaxID=670154 RepID=A0A1I6FUI0_9RHOB|nr:phosphotransferase [Litoreibacter janthinus]SFR33546.1 Ser/Thr protein kinase RdoA involved in Cpx stress response, MazF antagonist [Litoreibacter janthinus]